MNDNHKLSNTYIILDLDRTLLDTEAVTAIYQTVIRESNAALADDMASAKDATEREGGSFDVHEFVKSYVSSEDIRRYDAEFIERSLQQDVMNPGGRELIRRLDEIGATYGIVTYGNTIWQLLKIQAAGLDDIPHMVTPNQRKGHVLRSWQESNGAFRLPVDLVKQDVDTSRLFERLVLLDDKAVSFEDLPMNVFGVWYKPSDELLQAQQGNVSTDVPIIRRLEEFLGLLKP